jgi:hypothetical protein
MLSPTIREDLGRLRQIELAREAERRGRLAIAPQASFARRKSSAFLALLSRRSMASASPRPQESRALRDEPFVALRALSSDKTRVLGNR